MRAQPKKSASSPIFLLKGVKGGVWTSFEEEGSEKYAWGRSKVCFLLGDESFLLFTERLLLRGKEKGGAYGKDQKRLKKGALAGIASVTRYNKEDTIVMSSFFPPPRGRKTIGKCLGWRIKGGPGKIGHIFFKGGRGGTH